MRILATRQALAVQAETWGSAGLGPSGQIVREAEPRVVLLKGLGQVCYWPHDLNGDTMGWEENLGTVWGI